MVGGVSLGGRPVARSVVETLLVVCCRFVQNETLRYPVRVRFVIISHAEKLPWRLESERGKAELSSPCMTGTEQHGIFELSEYETKFS